MIDLEKMAKEHEKLFPNATLESQVWKLEEELKEFQSTETEQDEMKELADVLIVCGGLYRWCPLLAKTQADSVYGTICYIDVRVSDFEKEVNRKWQINLKRKWEWNGKTYHHIEEKNDENTNN